MCLIGFFAPMHMLWDLQNEKYCALIEKLNIFKPQEHVNSHDMFSHLNVLVNEINALGMDIIDDVYN